jgi:hypothetical protein
MSHNSDSSTQSFLSRSTGDFSSLGLSWMVDRISIPYWRAFSCIQQKYVYRTYSNFIYLQYLYIYATHTPHNVYYTHTHTQTLYCILYNCTLGRRTQGTRGTMVHLVAHTWFRTISIYYTAFDEGVYTVQHRT